MFNNFYTYPKILFALVNEEDFTFMSYPVKDIENGAA